MKRYFSYLFAAALFVQAAVFAGSIQWNQNYADGLSKAKAQSKPVVLFFTGSNWCVWCKKLDSEVFATPEFAQEVGDQFVFVELDYPMGGTKNQDLKAKYQIRAFPTVVVLDSNGNEIGRTGYEAGGGKKFANTLKKMAGK